jgi:hypothetical protein
VWECCGPNVRSLSIFYIRSLHISGEHSLLRIADYPSALLYLSLNSWFSACVALFFSLAKKHHYTS